MDVLFGARLNLPVLGGLAAQALGECRVTAASLTPTAAKFFTPLPTVLPHLTPSAFPRRHCRRFLCRGFDLHSTLQ